MRQSTILTTSLRIAYLKIGLGFSVTFFSACSLTNTKSDHERTLEYCKAISTQTPNTMHPSPNDHDLSVGEPLTKSPHHKSAPTLQECMSEYWQGQTSTEE